MSPPSEALCHGAVLQRSIQAELPACLALSLAAFSADYLPGHCLPAVHMLWCVGSMHSALTASACAWPGCSAWLPPLAQPAQTLFCTTYHLTCGNMSASLLLKHAGACPSGCRIGGATVLLVGVGLWSLGTVVAPPLAHMSLLALCASRVFVSRPQLPKAGCALQSACMLPSLSSRVTRCLALCAAVPACRSAPELMDISSVQL